jgi:hypothetical protein
MAGRRKANGEGTIFPRADGRWCGSGYVQAADGTRKRIYVYGTTRREAADKLAAKLADSHRGLVVAADPNLTVGDYLTAWLTGVARHRLRATTYDTYESLVRRFLIPGLGHRKLATLNVRDVRTFLDRIATVCQCCTWGWDAKRDPNHRRADRRPRCCSIGVCCGKHVRPATVRYIRAVLSAALADGVREDILARNVASPVWLPIPRSDFQPFTAGEARRYLLAAAYHRHGPLFELALRTGLRQGSCWACAGMTSTWKPGTSTCGAPWPGPGAAPRSSRSRPTARPGASCYPETASPHSSATGPGRTSTAARPATPGKSPGSCSPPASVRR